MVNEDLACSKEWDIDKCNVSDIERSFNKLSEGFRNLVISEECTKPLFEVNPNTETEDIKDQTSYFK